MDYTVTAITREQIPNNICVYSKRDIEFRHFIFMFEFMGDFKIIFESDQEITTIEDIMEDLKYYWDVWLDIKDNCNNSTDFQRYYFENYDKYLGTEYSEKIWNYHVDNHQFLNNIIIYYEGDSESYDEFIADEGICIDY